MSEELALKTSQFIEGALKEMQEAKSPQHLANREPQTWMLIARHCLEGNTRVTEFRNQHGIRQKLYYSVRNDLMHRGDFESLRTQWGHEFGSLVEATRELQWQINEKLSDSIASGEYVPEGKDLAQVARAGTMAFDTFQKATGGNIQRVEVSHVVTQEEYEDKAAELRAKIAKAKEAEQVIDVD
jgi:hypothetical protein